MTYLKWTNSFRVRTLAGTLSPVDCNRHSHSHSRRDDDLHLRRKKLLPGILATRLGMMELEVAEAEIILSPVLGFKKIQMADKYPKGQARGRHWKHLKHILQAENYQNYPPEEPNYINIESPPSMYPSKKYCDITGFEAPYVHPRKHLRYANTAVFDQISRMRDDYVQRYLSLRNAAVVLK